MVRYLVFMIEKSISLSEANGATRLTIIHDRRFVQSGTEDS
jgi:hypothetical protein